MRVLLIILLVSAVTTVFAQNAQRDLKRINESYLKTPSYSMSIVYKVYANASDNAPTDAQYGSLEKSRNQYCATYFNSVVIQEDSIKCIIDNNAKKILLKRKHKSVFETAIPDFSKMLKLCSKVDYQASGAEGIYSLHFKNNQYSHLEVVFDTATYFVHSFSIIYSKKSASAKRVGKMEISCSNIKINPKISSKDFKLDKYLKKVNGNYVAQPAYKTYQLILL